MSRRRNLAISLSAAAVSAALVYTMYALQIKQLEGQQTVQVAVPERFIRMGERLDADLLELKSIPASVYAEDMFTDLSELIGMETAVPLGEQEPVLAWKVSPYRMLPRRDEATFQIPRSYVLSISNGIRAGDRVVVYATGAADESVRLFDKPVTVASVKTAANQEVDDVRNPNVLSMASGNQAQMYASRRDANAMIDAINLNLTEHEWLLLDETCKQGETKLVIAFSPESFDVAANGLLEPQTSGQRGDE